MKVFSNKKLSELLGDPRVRASGIAEFAGISVQSLYAIRDGKSVPGANTLGALASAFGKSTDYFFEDECKYSDNKNMQSLFSESEDSFEVNIMSTSNYKCNNKAHQLQEEVV